MAEARDFHCYSHVFENLENWTIPSQTTLPIDKHCEDPQNEECGPVANTTSCTLLEENTHRGRAC